MRPCYARHGVSARHATCVSLFGQRHFGLVFTSARRFPRSERGIGRLVAAPDALCDDWPDDDALLNQTWWLTSV